MPTFPRTKTAQLSQFELRSVWQSRIGSKEAEERGREKERRRRSSDRRGERQSNEQGEEKRG